MATSATPSNGAYTPFPGQALLGSRVEPDPLVTTRKHTATGGLAVGGNVPTIAILSGAGTVGAISAATGYDQAGQFTLTAGTASIFGGSLASVTFGQPLAASPAAVIVDAAITSGTVSFSIGAVSVSKTGFVIQGGAPTSGQAYVINYMVLQGPFS